MNSSALFLVRAKGERLLELIDHEEQAIPLREGIERRRGPSGSKPRQRPRHGISEGGERVLSRPEQNARPPVAAGEHAPGHRGKQPRAHDGRLAASGRAHDTEQRRADEPRNQLGHEPFASVEVMGVRGLE